MYYFDHSATTPPHTQVIEAIKEVMEQFYGNPSSIHRLGMEAERVLDKARSVIANQFAIHPEQVIFTSGGTESNNLAIKGIAYPYRKRHLITTQIEHASVYQCFEQLEGAGFDVTYLPVDGQGLVDLHALKTAIRKDTVLVSVMHVNNEIGTIQPIREIAELLASYPTIKLHVDAVQSVGKLPLDFAQSGIDLMSMSAHKLGGPRGAGLLLRKQGLQLQPLLHGGGQEFSLRAGTENVAAIVGMAKALRLANENLEQKMKHLHHLRSIIRKQINQLPQLRYNGAQKAECAAPHIVHFSFPGHKAEVIVHAMEKLGFYVSTRSACSSSNPKPSRVLLATGVDERTASSGIRISMASEQSEQDVHQLCRALQKITAEYGV